MLLDAFWSEVIGTGILILLGAGVVANVILPRNKGFGPDWLLINFGWGLAAVGSISPASPAKNGLSATHRPTVTAGFRCAPDLYAA